MFHCSLFAYFSKEDLREVSRGCQDYDNLSTLIRVTHCYENSYIFNFAWCGKMPVFTSQSDTAQQNWEISKIGLVSVFEAEFWIFYGTCEKFVCTSLPLLISTEYKYAPNNCDVNGKMAYTVKKGLLYPVPSRDATYQTLPMARNSLPSPIPRKVWSKRIQESCNYFIVYSRKFQPNILVREMNILFTSCMSRLHIRKL